MILEKEIVVSPESAFDELTRYGWDDQLVFFFKLSCSIFTMVLLNRSKLRAAAD